MADVAQLRKRVRTEMDLARRAAADRRERSRLANRAYEQFLDELAIPTFRQLAGVLRAEGLTFDVQTPAGGVRLAPERQREEGLTLELDTSEDPPRAMLVSVRARGSRSLRTERALRERGGVEHVTEDELVDRVLEELRPWLE